MIGLRELLNEVIKKRSLPLKSEDEIIAILKRRLTKKEFKILTFLAQNIPQNEQCQKLSLDDSRYAEVKTKALKKVNFHSLKSELMVEES